MLSTILIAVAGILLVLYLVRRRKRLRTDD
jgi:hypothetical protein